MFEIKVIGDFSSAHNLRGYLGRCEELHVHNWKVEVVLFGKRLDKTGMLIDFKKVKATINEILDRLDHKYLNDISYFRKVNPTSENIAKYIYDNLKLISRGVLAPLALSAVPLNSPMSDKPGIFVVSVRIDAESLRTLGWRIKSFMISRLMDLRHFITGE